MQPPALPPPPLGNSVDDTHRRFSAKLTKVVSPLGWALALAVAAGSDALSVPLEAFPTLQWIADGVTAALLFFLIGRPKALIIPLLIEAIPAIGIFPTWVVAVMMLWRTSTPDHAAQNAKPNILTEK